MRVKVLEVCSWFAVRTWQSCARVAAQRWGATTPQSQTNCCRCQEALPSARTPFRGATQHFEAYWLIGMIFHSDNSRRVYASSTRVSASYSKAVCEFASCQPSCTRPPAARAKRQQPAVLAAVKLCRAWCMHAAVTRSGRARCAWRAAARLPCCRPRAPTTIPLTLRRPHHRPVASRRVAATATARAQQRRRGRTWKRA